MSSLPHRLIRFFVFAAIVHVVSATDRPNILWITSEDHGPEMGCYGDTYATTPHIDALAAKGLRYNHAWSTAPVCAPARTTIISGLYPTSTGSHHMRSKLVPPTGKPTYPAYLRNAGYYCTNNQKEDYNLLLPEDLWDESSQHAHWKNRSGNQPFFAVFNSTVSHESKIRTRPHQAVHDPAQAPVPPFHPDDPAVRQDWAQYYDVVSQADAIAGQHLADLAAAGLEADTIVFYYGDHGSGMPGYKRSPSNRGLHVPLVVYIPEKFAHLRPDDYVAGGASDRLVGFIDLAPTLLSLVGIEPPAWMQGHAFLGEYIAPAPAFMFGFRGRMDERDDNVRVVSDGRYVYVRNFRPDLPAGQHVAYQMITPTTRIWHEHFLAGKTNTVQSAFWLPTPAEELYDLSTDPHEIHNLATDPAHRAVRDRLSSALFVHLEDTRDLALIPEAEMHRLAKDQSPYEWAWEPGNYDFPKIQPLAGRASIGPMFTAAEIAAQLRDADSLVRYWTVRSLSTWDTTAIREVIKQLPPLLDDPSVDVSVTAAGLLVQHGSPSEQAAGLDHLAEWVVPTSNHFELMAALSVIDHLGPLAAPLHTHVQAFPGEDETGLARGYRGDVEKLVLHILASPPNAPRP